MTFPAYRLPRNRRSGFTLIEVLGAVLLSSIIITIVLSFQINLGSAMQNSRERLREQRQAVALLDRVARDLLGSYFIASSETETETAGTTQDSPWIFLTVQDFLEEEDSLESSNAIKFITRNYVAASLDGHSSDLAVVAYYIEPQEDRPGYKLMRWRTTHMPEEYDPSFPDPDDPSADVIGEDIAWFRIRAINHTGGEEPVWDSELMTGLESLPVGIKLELSVLTAAEVEAANNGEDFEIGDYDEDELDVEVDGDEDEGIGDSKRPSFSKTVLLPLRPLDWSFLEEVARSTSMADLLAADRDGDGIPDSQQQGDDEDDDDDEDDRGDSLDNGFDGDNEGFDEDDDFDDSEFFDDEDDFESLNFDPARSQFLAGGLATDSTSAGSSV